MAGTDDTGRMSEAPFESLDPQDWGAMRRLAHQMIDDAFDDLRGLRERPTWRPMPPENAACFERPLPRLPEGAERAYQDYREAVAPYRMGNDHPRFWAYYMGNGTVLGALAEFVAAIDASNLGGGATGAVRVEQQVVAWCKEILGLPEDASGLMTSGASMANLMGLAVARNQAAGVGVRTSGLRPLGTPFHTYGSVELHSCHQRAVELLGLGSSSLRKLPVDDAHRLDLDALAAAITEDRAAGAVPMAVVANAGTINTGAVDDLHAIADLCVREGVWMHVDAAIGAPVKLAPTLSHLVGGLERADSVALDLHKWMHMPFEAGMLLVRDAEAHRTTFSLTPDYLEPSTRGLAGGPVWFHEYGPQLSRAFRALKVWMSLKEHGADRFGRLVERNITQAHTLAKRLAATGKFEIVAPMVLDIVCFRLRLATVPEQDIDAFGRELVLRLQESGEAVVSGTIVNGRHCLRVAICNHRTSDRDLEHVEEVLMRLTAELVGEPGAWAGS